MKRLVIYVAIVAAGMGMLQLTGCSDDPEQENAPELITNVTLTFIPADGSAPVVVSAVDPDGEGPQDLVADGPIVLVEGVTYDLSIGLFNELLSPGTPGYNITEEVEEEGDEHQFFFGFSDGAFSSPAGIGNIAPATGTINYLDEDENGLPIGLLTRWIAGMAQTGKTFRVMLKHLPDIKSASSTSEDGETDVDVTFQLNIN